MGDCMNFPKDWAVFLEDYSFRDHKEFYTNGARLIPTFRVEQMMHHYLQKAKEDSVVVVHGRWEPWAIQPNGFIGSYCCTACKKVSITASDYCPNCGAKMDGGNEDG